MLKDKILKNKEEEKKMKGIQRLGDDTLSQVSGGYYTFRGIHEDGDKIWGIYHDHTHKFICEVVGTEEWAKRYDQIVNGKNVSRNSN